MKTYDENMDTIKMLDSIGNDGKIRKGNNWVEPKGELQPNQRIENGIIHTRVMNPIIVRELVNAGKSKYNKVPNKVVNKLPWYKRLWRKIRGK